MFEQESSNPCGVYLVKIYQENAWKYIIVDDLIPCVRKRVKGSKHQYYFNPVFVNTKVQEGSAALLWPFLLEKAYASYYGSYESLSYGNSVDFISELTGAPYKEIHLTRKKTSKRSIEDTLLALEDYLMK